MRTVRVVITLKPDVLDAPGQAIRQGLRALGFAVDEVRAGKYLELALPDGAGDVEEMCARFLANPLIETWRIEEGERQMATAGGTAE